MPWLRLRREVLRRGRRPMLNVMEVLKPPVKAVKGGEAQGLKRRFQEIPRDLIILFCAFLVMCAVFAILKPQFLNWRNIINVFRHMAVIFILASGQTFAILSAGIDMSQGAIAAWSASSRPISSLSMAPSGESWPVWERGPSPG